MLGFIETKKIHKATLNKSESKKNVDRYRVTVNKKFMPNYQINNCHLNGHEVIDKLLRYLYCT